MEVKSMTDSSEEMDAFTTEYKKILKQLPSMLKRAAEPIPQHLQNYINRTPSNSTSYSRHPKHTKSSKSKRKRSQPHKSRHSLYNQPSNPNLKNKTRHHPITIIDDENDEYPPLITDSYFNITKYTADSADETVSSTQSSCDLPIHHIKQNKKRKRSKSVSTSSSTPHHLKQEPSKYYIQSTAHPIPTTNDDVVTIQQLKRINEMLSSRHQHPRKDDTPSKDVQPSVHPVIHQKDISTQTEPMDEIKKEVRSVSIQTDKAPDVRVNTSNTKINEMICKLTKQLNDKTTQCTELKQENECLENELKVFKKECMESKLEINGWKQQIEDQTIYNNNLIKHLDEKSRNEALLRKEMSEQQKQLEAAHFKLQQFLIPKHNKNENQEMSELREHLMISEQKGLDWKKKWKQQCYKIEQLESEKVMSEHRLDQQLQEYQKIIQDFRNMMKNNLESVNTNFQNLNQENMALKSENERLLFELGKFQENAFKNGLKEHLKEDLNEKNNEINALTQQLSSLQKNLEKSHLNGTMDKAVQCMVVDGDKSEEFNEISIEIYKLIMDLKSKSFDIINEYGFKSLTNSPTKKNEQRNELYQDTDDVDRTSMIINCKKRFYDTKQMLKQLLKWFDDVMYQQAEQQCDQCITQ